MLPDAAAVHGRCTLKPEHGASCGMTLFAPQPLTLRLSVELVPASTWYENVRSEVSQALWKQLKQRTAREAGYRCEICSGRGPRWPVECHERWEYDETTRVQRLVGLVSLCPACHEVKHFGFAASQGHAERALRTLMRVNLISRDQAQAHVEEAFILWQKRSAMPWTVDLSWLHEFIPE